VLKLRGFLVFLVLAMTLSFFFGTAAYADDAGECVEDKAEAVAKSIVCHVDSEDGERCDRRLQRRIRRAERDASHECPASPDAAELGEWTHKLSERVIESVDGRRTPTDLDFYLANRGPDDPDPRRHMHDLVEYARQNRLEAVKFCAEQDPPVPASECSGGVPFCAFVVDRQTDTVVARACNHGSANPVLHGEIAAINAVANVFQAQGKSFSAVAPHHDLYTTGEPCAMCSSAIMWSGFKTMFYGSSIATLAHYYSQIQISNSELTGLWAECQAPDDLIVRTRVVGPVLEVESDELFAEFGFQFCSAVTEG